MISLLQSFARVIFGEFEREEFKKFLRMGLIFAFIIGAYWTLRVLKDTVFINLVGQAYIPWAKTASLICLFPLVIFYTKLLDRLSREKMFYTLATAYGIATLVFGVLILSPIGQASTAEIATRTGFLYYATKVLGYAWYVYVESFGSLMVALFWAFASDITKPESAKKGFSLVVAIGQLGGIVGPWFINQLPQWLGMRTNALPLFICSGVILFLIYLIKNFLTETPKELLTSFHGKNETQVEKEQEPGFFEGLRLLLSHKYLLGIFAVISFYEIIVTIFDFHFKYLAATMYTDPQALGAYLGSYGSLVNAVSLACLLLGINNITRILGVGVALALMPIIVGLALFGFISISSLNFLFWLMVGSKAINYALNGPALKQLYIPTTHDVRFKSQAWIETFGSRGSKEIGAIFNMGLSPLQSSLGKVAGRARHIALSAWLGFAMVGVWFVIALYLGRTYKKAIDQNKVVC